jgi:hypothetical protein
MVFVVKAYSILHIRRDSPVEPPKRHTPKCSGGHTGAIRCTGGSLGCDRRAKMSIRRIAPLHPPAISAEVLQNLHELRIFCTFVAVPAVQSVSVFSRLNQKGRFG